MKLLLTLSSLVVLLGSTIATESPVLMFSYREIPSIVDQMPAGYSIERNRQTESEFDLFTRKLVASCPSDAYVLIDQLGASLDDFYPAEDNVLSEDDSVWKNIRKHMAFSGTVYTGSVDKVVSESGSTESSLPSFETLVNSLIKQCDCQLIEADLTRDDKKPFDKYIDTRCRIIRVQFPALPKTLFSRILALTANDEWINKIMGFVPSPFVTTLYTSSDPTEPKSVHSEAIFGDILAKKQDPRHRRQWEKHMDIIERRKLESRDVVEPGFQKEIKPPHREIGWKRAQKYAKNVKPKFLWPWEADESEVDPNEVLIISNETLVAVIASLIVCGLSMLCLKFSFGLVKGEKKTKPIKSDTKITEKIVTDDSTE